MRRGRPESYHSGPTFVRGRIQTASGNSKVAVARCQMRGPLEDLIESEPTDYRRSERH